MSPADKSTSIAEGATRTQARQRVAVLRRRWFVLVLGLAACLGASAQDETDPCAPPEDKKIVKLLDEAAKAKDPAERHAKLKSTLEIDAECVECNFRLGLSAYRIAKEGRRGFAPAIKYLEAVHARCPDYHSDLHYTLGAMLYAEGKYAEAARSFAAFLRFPREDAARVSKNYDKQQQDVSDLMPELEFYADFYRHSAPLDPRPLANVNTAADEYLPMLSPDNELLLFTRKRQERAKGDPVSHDVEELLQARRSDLKSDFDAGAALDEPFNTGDSYGGLTISVNNKEMFVTVGGPADVRGYRNFDIHRSHYDTKFNLDFGGQEFVWNGLDRLPEGVNGPDSWESQPSLSGDGRTIYFATARADSKGMDIYSSTRDAKGVWGAAKPVPGICTEGDEKAPFMHSDSRTLYFAARPNAQGQGHRSIGGYDIFFSKLNDDGTWSKPRNIGHPINTEHDEQGLIVSADGRSAYFASNRFKGYGGLDLFSIELPTDARPDEILIVKGQVRDEKGQLVRGAEVEVKYMDTRKIETLRADSTDGRYAAVLRLKPGSDVVLTVKKEGHVFDSRSFALEDTVRHGVAKVDMSVQKIEVNRSYRVNDIKYATNSAEITKSSEYILDELIGFLKSNPGVRIRIEGHTDNVGQLADNLALSNDRAFTVMGYLQRQGIAAGRLSFKGLGPNKPVATNDTPEGRAQNRRTEFVIVGR